MNIYFTNTNTTEELTAYIFSIPSAREKAIETFKNSNSKKCFEYIRRHEISRAMKQPEFTLFGLTFKEVK